MVRLPVTATWKIEELPNEETIVKPRLQVVKTADPPGRKSGVKVASAAELVSKLKDEAGVL